MNRNYTGVLQLRGNLRLMNEPRHVFGKSIPLVHGLDGHLAEEITVGNGPHRTLAALTNGPAQIETGNRGIRGSPPPTTQSLGEFMLTRHPTHQGQHLFRRDRTGHPSLQRGLAQAAGANDGGLGVGHARAPSASRRDNGSRSSRLRAAGVNQAPSEVGSVVENAW